MIKKIKISNFTVIHEETILFSDGLNIIIGENAVGKSHLLKLAYTLAFISYKASKTTPSNSSVEASAPSKLMFQKMIGEKLVNVYRPDSLGRLVQRKKGRNRCDIEIFFENPLYDFSFYFSTNSKTDVTLTKMPEAFVQDIPIFLPTREVVSIFPGFTALYRDRHIEFDETYYDLCLALESSTLRGARFAEIKALVEPLEEVIGGSIKVENGRFYLAIPGKGTMEIALVAKGLRKIAMLAYLITNGSLKNSGMLFWDEPETNLNPKLIKRIAQTLIILAQSGIQVFVATHSLFLMRELEILSSSQPLNRQRYIALSEQAEGVVVAQGDGIDAIDSIVALDEELMQSDRFMGASQDDRH